MDNDTQKLIAIQQELERVAERLGELFTTEHLRWRDVFEDMGAAGYYIQEAGYRLESVKRTLRNGEEDEEA